MHDIREKQQEHPSQAPTHGTHILSQLLHLCNGDSLCFLLLRRGLVWPSLTFKSRPSSLSLQCWLSGICQHTQLEGLSNHSVFCPSATPGFINATARKLSCTSKKEWPLSFWKSKMARVRLCSQGSHAIRSLQRSLTISCSCGNRLPA